MICDNCLHDCDHATNHEGWELCDTCLNAPLHLRAVPYSTPRPKRAQTDLDLVQLSPDMFDSGKTNVFFSEEQVGSIAESKGMFVATPHGIQTGLGCFSKENALLHLLQVRKASIEKKEKLTVEKTQLSMF